MDNEPVARSPSNRFYTEDVPNGMPTPSNVFLLDRRAEARIVDKGIILPAQSRADKKGYEGGACDQNFNFIKESSSCRYVILNSAYKVERETIEQVDEDVIYGGVAVSHFGHFMADHWSRLWYVVQHPEQKLKVAFLLMNEGKKPWHDEFFDLVGITSERRIYIDHPMQFRSVIVPGDALIGRHVNYTENFMDPYRYVRDHVDAANIKKVYLSRVAFNKAKANGTHVFGEKYFEDFFARHGFKVVSPETLSIKDQVALIKGADEIACVWGTLSHWAMFCRPGTKLIALNRKRFTPAAINRQPLINEASGVDYYRIDVYKNFMFVHPNSGVCMLGVTEAWKNFVRDYFGERIDYDDNIHFNELLDEYIVYWRDHYFKTTHVVDSLRSLCRRLVALEQMVKIERPTLTCEAHIGKKGWLPADVEGNVIGMLDQQLDIQAIKIKFSAPYYDINYSVYYPDEGWTEAVSTGKMAGTTGKSKPIFGVKMSLDSVGASKFDIAYRLHNFDGSWSAWRKNGEAITSPKVRLNAIQIKLIERITPPPWGASELRSKRSFIRKVNSNGGRYLKEIIYARRRQLREIYQSKILLR